eukprot:8220186-Heterocapsa_arctica.AAC.1
MSPYKPSVAKAISSILKEFCPDLVPTIAVPSDSEALKEEFFGPQHWYQSEWHFNIGCTPYGSADVRYLTKGSYIMAGVRSDELVGKTMQEKVERILTDAGAR